MEKSSVIMTSSSLLSQVPQVKPQPEIKTATVENLANPPTNSNLLQPDQVEISKAGQEKVLQDKNLEKELIKDEEETEVTEDEEVEKKVMNVKETEKTTKSEESELDKQIKELSLEILEITIQIELLKSKEDAESVKERQSLEVDLAIKKGVLEATIKRKSDITKFASHVDN